jgi:hypothetical protein
MNPKNYPLTQSKDIERIKREFHKLSLKEADLVEEFVDKNQHMIHLIEKENPRFYFIVYNPNQSADYKSYFNLKYLPEHEHTFDNSTFNLQIDQIIEHFNRWTSLLRQFNSISYTQDHLFLKMYEDEFYNAFSFDDSPADPQPLSHKTQVFLMYFLEAVINGLKEVNQNDSEIQNIISDAEEIRNDIQNLDQKVAVKRIASIWARLKKKSLPLLNTFLEKAKDELFKRGISWGYDAIGHFLHNHHLLP